MSATAFPHATFDTAQVRPEHRFEAWRAIVGQTHEIDATPDGFQARVTSTVIGRMVATEMSASTQSVARSPQRVRRDGLDHIVLHLTSSGFGVERDDDRFQVPTDAVTLNTLARPFQRTSAPERGSLILSLPRDLVTEVLPEPEFFHGQVLQGGIGRLVREHMRTLVRHVQSVAPTEVEGLARATVHLLAAGLEPTRGRIGEARTSLDAAAIVRCRRYVEHHLRSPNLTPDAICRAIGLSRATLYRLFADQGGVAAYIRSRRLQAARNALAAPERPRVSAVAHAYGFTDAAFSRAFRTAYGVSPSDAAAIGPAAGHGASFMASWMNAVAQAPHRR